MTEITRKYLSHTNELNDSDDSEDETTPNPYLTDFCDFINNDDDINIYPKHILRLIWAIADQVKTKPDTKEISIKMQALSTQLLNEHAINETVLNNYMAILGKCMELTLDPKQYRHTVIKTVWTLIKDYGLTKQKFESVLITETDLNNAITEMQKYMSLDDFDIYMHT